MNTPLPQPLITRQAVQHTNFPTGNQDNLDSLFKRVAEGDDYSAFEMIFRLNYKSLCTFANRIVRNHELAEEIVDDVFCNLWKNKGRIQINSSFRSYLITSVRNKSLDCLRNRKNEKNAMLESASSVPCRQSVAYESMAFEELSLRIEKAISELPRQCRT